jgi:amidase
MTQNFSHLPFLTAVELNKGFLDKKFSAVEIIEAHLARIHAVNPVINSIVTLCRESALNDAKILDKKLNSGKKLGALASVPVGIKDTTDVAEVRTTYGCKLFENHIPDKDSRIVQRLKQADAIIIGKTNTPEFATGANTYNEIFGLTRNPWDLSKSAGGSSGGGAAGLAGRLFALAEGTDLGGSLRVPAAFCGVVGIRPTPGSIPYDPNPAPYDLFDVEGLMARSATDVALSMSILAGPDKYYPISPSSNEGYSYNIFDNVEPVKKRAAFITDIAGVGIEPEILKTCQVAANSLADQGYEITTENLDLSAGRVAFTTLRAQWMLNRHLKLIDQRDQLGENLRGNIEKGLSQTPLDIAKGETVRAECWQKITHFMNSYDIILTPCTPVSPFNAEQNYPDEINGQPMASYIDWIAPTFVISLIGLPAANVPAGLTATGMPVGLQIIGRRHDDLKILGIANAIQQNINIGSPPKI